MTDLIDKFLETLPENTQERFAVLGNAINRMLRETAKASGFDAQETEYLMDRLAAELMDAASRHRRRVREGN